MLFSGVVWGFEIWWFVLVGGLIFLWVGLCGVVGMMVYVSIVSVFVMLNEMWWNVGLDMKKVL